MFCYIIILCFKLLYYIMSFVIYCVLFYILYNFTFDVIALCYVLLYDMNNIK